MERQSFRWRFMNPMEWLKAVYETFGTPYPRASLAVVGFLGAVCFIAVWLFAAKQVEKSHQVSIIAPVPAQVSGAASATNGSIANTGNGSTINQSPPPEKKPPKKE